MRIVQSVGTFEPQFQEVINGAIDRRQFKEITTPTADVEFSIQHGMGTVPLGYLVISRDKTGQTYASTTAWDEDKIYLKDSNANVALRILIF